MNDNINLNGNKKLKEKDKNNISFQLMTQIEPIKVEKMKELSNNRIGILLKPNYGKSSRLHFYIDEPKTPKTLVVHQNLLIYSLNTFKEIYKINSDKVIFDIIELKNHDLVLNLINSINIYKLSEKKYELFQTITINNNKSTNYISFYGLINGNLISYHFNELNIYHKKDLYILTEHLPNIGDSKFYYMKIIEMNKNKLIILKYLEYQSLDKRIGDLEKYYLILYYDIENKIEKRICKYYNEFYKPDILKKNEYLLIRDDDFLNVYNIIDIENNNENNICKTKVHIKHFPYIYNYLEDFIVLQENKEIYLYKITDKSLEFFNKYQFEFIKKRIMGFLNGNNYLSIILKNNNIVFYYEDKIYIIKFLRD